MDVNEARQTLAREILTRIYDAAYIKIMANYDLLSDEDFEAIENKMGDFLPVPPHPVRTETAYRLLAERNEA